MTFQNSEKLQNWFEQNEKIEGFWDFVYETELYDLLEDANIDHSDELVARGFELGLKAGNESVFLVSIDCDGGGYLNLYFIGDAQNIFSYLQAKLDTWLAELPSGTAEELKKAKVRKEIKKIEQELHLNKLRLEVLQKEL